MLKKIKNYFFGAFRAIFVYHHTSLEFRAKIYTVVIAGANEPLNHYQSTLEEIVREIYHEADRAEALLLTVKEYLVAIQNKKTMSDETLLIDIIKELRLVPRYALKIEPEHLRRLQECTHEHDSKIYQDRLIEFLTRKRSEYEELRR